jgi:TolB-like protein
MARPIVACLWAFTVAALGPGELRAQCADGSPPPCDRVAVRAPASNSVAVLYFDNLSRDTADAYLADGLTEEIIVRLGQIRRLDVKSRYEVRRVRGYAGGDPAVLGRSLNAANIVSGSVQKAGGRVRVRVEGESIPVVG